jgi:hypothetical protein
MTSSYRFRIGVEGWQRFCQEIGVKADVLVNGNYKGVALQVCGDNLCKLAPGSEELKALLASQGGPEDELVTAQDLQKTWRWLFAKICRE